MEDCEAINKRDFECISKGDFEWFISLGGLSHRRILPQNKAHCNAKQWLRGLALSLLEMSKPPSQGLQSSKKKKEFKT